MHIDTLNQMEHHIISTPHKVVTKEYAVTLVKALRDVLTAGGCKDTIEVIERLKETPRTLQMLTYLAHQPHAQSIRQTVADIEEYEKNIKI